MKKIIKIFVMLFMLTSLVACGSGNKGASSGDYKLENVKFPLKEKLSLKMMINSSPLAPKDPNEKAIFKRLEEETNLHIDWTNYTNDFVEKRNLDIASGDLPDAIWNAAASDIDILQWAKSKVIVPVDELIDKYMPNLKKIYEENPQYKKMATAPDGKMYTFPWIEELGEKEYSIHTVNDMAWINTDWLKKLNLEMPKNPQDLLNVLKAFKEKDPNGNGKQDEIPLSFIDNPGNEDFKILIAAFGGDGDNDDHLVVGDDGKLNFTADDKAYRDAISYFHELEKNGLIDPEAFEQDWNTYIAKGKEHKYGVYFTWDKANVSGMNDSYDVLPVLEGPNGEKNITRTNNIGFSRDTFVITSKNKNLELTARWIDKMYEPLQSVQNNWGTYGEEGQNIFELVEKNGHKSLEHMPLEGTAPGELRQKTEVRGPLAVLDDYYGDYTTMPDDAKWRIDLIKEYYSEYVKHKNIYPRVFMSAEDAEKIAQIDADLFPYIERKRAEFIKSGITDKTWDEYIKELDRLGLKKWLSIKQKYYDEY
ncbi:ABC transporter substrate-binding protein [Helcococcus kunzii]|uniref:ABC transporter substrate-binding protein n=1 Tax=Helcococcus kunzii TaxID=40091 RepID=UPI0024AD82BC|nr:ABC transporter substrate-binding protein [Helcococcus kunzii]